MRLILVVIKSNDEQDIKLHHIVENIWFSHYYLKYILFFKSRAFSPKTKFLFLSGHFLFPVAVIQTATCKLPLVLLIYTGDNKFLCQGEHYEVFPKLPNDVEILECPSQFFTEFPAGTFENKSHLSAIDIPNGKLEILSRDTFEGAKSLWYFNAAGCNIQGEIPSETFCDHTPELRSVDLSDNPKYVFTSKPFECLDKLEVLSIEGTIQNCDPDTVTWINELIMTNKTVVGNICSARPMPVCPPQGTFPTTQCLTLILSVKIHDTIDSCHYELQNISNIVM